MEAIARKHRRVHQFGDARHHRRQRPAADPGRGVRGRDPRRRQGRRRQPARLPRRARGGAEAARLPQTRRPDKRERRPRLARRCSNARRSTRSIARRPRATSSREGVRRLADYQDEAYARLYLDRLAPIRDADARAKADGRLLRETARHLAVRMSYEDVIRVAQAKTDPARFARIAAEVGAKPGEPVKVVRIPQARRRGIVLGAAAVAGAAHPRVRRAPREARALPLGHGGQHHVGVAAICASALLATLRRWRPRTYRYAEEQRAIERWLGADRRGRRAIRRARARDRRMRAADQGLWRHPQARHRQLPR